MDRSSNSIYPTDPDSLDSTLTSETAAAGPAAQGFVRSCHLSLRYSATGTRLISDSANDIRERRASTYKEYDSEPDLYDGSNTASDDEILSTNSRVKASPGLPTPAQPTELRRRRLKKKTATMITLSRLHESLKKKLSRLSTANVSEDDHSDSSPRFTGNTHDHKPRKSLVSGVASLALSTGFTGLAVGGGSGYNDELDQPYKTPQRKASAPEIRHSRPNNLWDKTFSSNNAKWYTGQNGDKQLFLTRTTPKIENPNLSDLFGDVDIFGDSSAQLYPPDKNVDSCTNSRIDVAVDGDNSHTQLLHPDRAHPKVLYRQRRQTSYKTALSNAPSLPSPTTQTSITASYPSALPDASRKTVENTSKTVKLNSNSDFISMADIKRLSARRSSLNEVQTPVGGDSAVSRVSSVPLTPTTSHTPAKLAFLPILQLPTSHAVLSDSADSTASSIIDSSDVLSNDDSDSATSDGGNEQKTNDGGGYPITALSGVNTSTHLDVIDGLDSLRQIVLTRSRLARPARIARAKRNKGAKGLDSVRRLRDKRIDTLLDQSTYELEQLTKSTSQVAIVSPQSGCSPSGTDNELVSIFRAVS